MGVRDLQGFLEADCQSACKAVDLLKIARTYQAKRRGKSQYPGRLRLVVDAESCLDRLYGGFYSDWACGGQWNRMNHFLGILIQACQGTNMELVVFFNGAAETERLSEWAEQMSADKKKVASVLKHIHHKATPPPKVWWVAPVCLRQCLRMALRQLGVAVACSMDDHHQEVIAYCRENRFDGIVADDAEYAIFDPPRYFSSQNLKLTYRQALETKEYMMNEVAQHWDLDPKRFCILAALLGNHILPETDLKFFYESITTPGNQTSTERIKAVVDYVRALKSENIDDICSDVFKYERTGIQVLTPSLVQSVNKFKKSIQYYLNGTQEGFLNYKPKGLETVSTSTKQPGSYPGKREKASKEDAKPTPSTMPKETDSTSTKVLENGDGQEVHEEEEEEDEDFKELKADSVYMDRESGYANPDAPAIVIDPPSTSRPDLDKLADAIEGLVLHVAEVKEAESKSDAKVTADKEKAAEVPSTEKEIKSEDPKVSSTPSASSSTNSTPAPRISPDPKDKSTSKKKKPTRQAGDHTMPPVPPEIMRIASERHQKGLMAPWIYQVLSQGEIKIEVTMEDESTRDLPIAVELFRPIRQCIYAILFDMSKRPVTPNKPLSSYAASIYNKEVIVREWTVPRGTGAPRADLVYARPLDWKLPPVRRLWLGQAVEDKNRRLRALLTCLRSDTPRMLNTAYVPQHLLIMACILRYMMLNQDARVLRKHELDAFLCASVSPLLHDVETMQEMKLPMITSRGVQLAALFMRGVETAIFANDACGAPIPWAMCCPWLFFDGKLFHFKLLKANNNTVLLDICDGSLEQMMRVERMRSAILDGIPLDALFAKPNLGAAMMRDSQQYSGGGHFFPPSNNITFRPAGASSSMMGGHMGGPMSGPMGDHMGGSMDHVIGRGRGLLGRSPVDSRGGQLQIAGVVVGNWGANVQANQARPGHQHHHRGGSAPPHIMAVGPRRGGGGGAVGMLNNRPGPRGRGLMNSASAAYRMQPASHRPGSAERGYNTKCQNGIPRSNITGIKSGIRSSGGPVRGSIGANRGKPRIRGPAGYNPSKVSVQMRSKVAVPLGRGRGMTVEHPHTNSVVSVDEIQEVVRQELGQGDDRDFGQFVDAADPPVKRAEVKVNLDRDDDIGESTL